MKKLIYILFLLMPFLTKAQIDIVNLNVTDPTDNTVYSGITNLIQVKGIDAKDLFVVSSSNGSMNKQESNMFLFIPQKGELDTLKVMADQQIVATKIFKVRSLCNPVGALGKIEGSTATVKEIIADPEIKIKTPGCDVKEYYRTFGYTVKFVSSKGKIIREIKEFKGNRFTADQLKIIKTLKAKDKIILTVFLTCIDCTIGGVHDIEITII